MEKTKRKRAQSLKARKAAYDEEFTAREKAEEAKGLIVVTAPAVEERFRRWFENGSRVAVFRNQDMSSGSFGMRVFLRLTVEEAAKVEVGKTAAPDGPYGPGWKFILESVEGELEKFAFLPYEPPT